MKPNESWECVDFIFTEDNQLEIALTEYGYKLIQECIETNNFGRIPLDIDVFADLIGDALCDEWDLVDPEITEDLNTNPFMISDNMELDDHGDLVDIQSCYYYNEYATTNIIHALDRDGKVVFQRHSYKKETL